MMEKSRGLIQFDAASIQEAQKNFEEGKTFTRPDDPPPPTQYCRANNSEGRTRKTDVVCWVETIEGGFEGGLVVTTDLPPGANHVQDVRDRNWYVIKYGWSYTEHRPGHDPEPKSTEPRTAPDGYYFNYCYVGWQPGLFNDTIEESLAELPTKFKQKLK